MIEHVPSWWPMAGYALGFVMGATTGPRFDLYRKWLRRLRMGPPRGSNGNCVPMPPSTPAPGMHRVYYDMPSTIAECGGPCTVGPTHCDCGALWLDVPTTPKPDIVPKPQYPGGYISLDGAQPFRVRRMPQPLPDELDAYTYQRGPEGDTPQPTAGGAVTDRDLAAFEHWWYVLGSGYRPMSDEDQEEHAHRVARLAWMACARQVIHLQLPSN